MYWRGGGRGGVGEGDGVLEGWVEERGRRRGEWKRGERYSMFNNSHNICRLEGVGEGEGWDLAKAGGR